MQSLFISSQFSYDEARQPFNKAKNRFANIHSCKYNCNTNSKLSFICYTIYFTLS